MEDRQLKSNQTLPYRKGEVDFSNCRSWMSKPFSRMRPEVGGNSPDIILGGKRGGSVVPQSRVPIGATAGDCPGVMKHAGGGHR